MNRKFNQEERSEQIEHKHYKEHEKRSQAPQKNFKKVKTASIRREMFSENLIPVESKKILEDFDKIVENVRVMSGKQKFSLYGEIKKLSHQLTDDRNSRRLGYMNEARNLSAYINYFMWWNLIRLTRLFANLPKTAFSALDSENPIAIDVGSGTLTVVIALWLARPELRIRNISWYCMDLSQTALSAGEDLYLSIAAKTMKENEDFSAWKIIRVRGAFGTKIKEKADLITCGNVFNEILQRNEMPTDFLAKKYTCELLSYLKNENSTVFLVEPGDPHSARFISLMRDALIREDFLPIAPCPHTESCPMAGRTHGSLTNPYGKNAKWCNFAFNTDSVPERLLRISEKAGLPKERAGLSFIIAKKTAEIRNRTNAVVAPVEITKNQGHLHIALQAHKLNDHASSTTFIRIASDFIRLPELHKSGYYACSQFGLLLAIDESHTQPKNGELLQIKTPENLDEIDKKSGGIIVRI